ncbi:hypothetical protein DB30_07232 [Enhygromyxa salina]|uniref:Uncharacterized protein n=2 Tax=Enhygromyxa salina TaxID=215803 RepID=A0A0C2D6T2_9BACT|nr:hypothetical protein DB30_07232 [Enhygromyxa salina]
MFVILLAACGTHSNAPAPDDREPPDPPQIDQHFCCNSVNSTGHGSGQGCVAINKENINTCAEILYCASNWTKNSDGDVKCLN